ncbi:MAG: hypothetical protein WCJ09_08510 [Planctomycetota bacterium]
MATLTGNFKVIRLAVVGALFVLCHHRASGVEETRSITPAEVRDAFNRWRSSVAYLEIRCETTGSDATSARVGRSRHHIAVQGCSRFVESRHFTEAFGWDVDLEASNVYIRPGEVDIYWLTPRVWDHTRQNANPKTNNKLAPFYNEFYLLATGWWPREIDLPNDDWRAPDVSVHRILDEQELNVVATEEVVSGRLCLVLEAKSENSLTRLWLDAKRGYVVVRKHSVFFDTSTGFLYENSDFREVHANFWLPLRVKRTVHRLDGGTEISDETVIAKSERLIQDIRTTAPATSVFEPPATSPGALSRDLDRGKVTSMPGGRELLDSLCDIAVTLVQKRASRSIATKSQQGTFVFSICILLLVGWLARTRQGSTVARNAANDILNGKH